MPTPEPPTLRGLLGVWLRVGIQSFGGGAATLALIHQHLVARRGWVDEETFARDWALCQLAPGINLVAFAARLGARIGERCGGAGIGVALAVLGLMLPSAAITVGITAAYARTAHHPAVAAALRAVVPATVGVGLWTAWQMLRPLWKADRVGAGVVALGAGAALLLLRPPVPLVLIAGALLGSAWAVATSRPRSAP